MSPSCSTVFFNSLARSRYLSFFSHSFSFILWSAETAKSTIQQILFFCWLLFGLVIWLLLLLLKHNAKIDFYQINSHGAQSQKMLSNITIFSIAWIFIFESIIYIYIYIYISQSYTYITYTQLYIYIYIYIYIT